MSLVLVSGYVAGWGVVFGTFVFCYYKRKSVRYAETWFPHHETRTVYLQLLEKKPTPDKATLKAALMRRAMTDVGRVVELREQKPALSQLVKTGIVGDDVWQELLYAEEEMEYELSQVAEEANRLESGWHNNIFQKASEMLGHERQKEAHSEAEKQRKRAEKEKAKREERERQRERKEQEKKNRERERLAEELIREEEENKKRLSSKKKSSITQ